MCFPISLALPFEIQPSVEETLVTQQACSEGVVWGAFFGAAAPSYSQPPGVGLSGSKPVHPIPPSSTSDCWHGHPALWGSRGHTEAGARMGWSMGSRGRGGGHGGGCASPKELRLAWHQDQGDPALPGCCPQDPGPGLAYQGSGQISRGQSRERVDREELGPELQGQ